MTNFKKLALEGLPWAVAILSLGGAVLVLAPMITRTLSLEKELVLTQEQFKKVSDRLVQKEASNNDRNAEDADSFRNKYLRVLSENEKILSDIMTAKADYSELLNQKQQAAAELDSLRKSFFEREKIVTRLQRITGHLSEKLQKANTALARLESENKNQLKLIQDNEKLKPLETNFADKKILSLENEIKKINDEKAQWKINDKKMREQVKQLQKQLNEKIKNEKRVSGDDAQRALRSLRNSDIKKEALARDAQAAHYNLGVLYARMGDYASAVTELESALAINSKDGLSHYNLAVIYDTRLQKPQEAMKHYEAYIRLLPKASDAGEVQKRLYQLQLEREVTAGQNLRYEMAR